MLQMKKIGALAHESLANERAFPPHWQTFDELEKETDAWMAAWLKKRRRIAAESGVLARFADSVDSAIRTDTPELLDRPNYPEHRKVRIINGLHRMNQFYRSYHRYVAFLTPLIEEIAAKEGRKVRLLELASGSGDLAIALSDLGQKKSLPLEITGSDYIPAYIAQANAKATVRDVPVRFTVINAFEMNDIPRDAYDIVLIAQAVHHFSPGQLAVMIAKSRQIATTAFVCIDARRQIDNLIGPLPFALFTLQFGLLHDAWISGRRYFSQYELTHIANIAVPDSVVQISRSRFPIDCMTVRY